MVLNLTGGVGDSAAVTVGFSAAANGLAPGLYAGTVDFTNTTGGAGTASRAVTLDVGRVWYPSTDTPIAITDNSTFTSNRVVADDFCIADVNVDMDISHTFIGDLIVSLTSPAGTTVTLHNRTGGSANDIMTMYDDEPGTGVTPPDGPGSLSDFDGESSLGTWTLTVSDNASADTGTLNGWSMGIAPNPSPICPQPELVHEFTLDADPGWMTQGQWATT